MTVYDGKWMLSSDEEDYSWAEEYNTRAEAEAAVPEFCEEHDQDCCFVGQARAIRLADVFDASMPTWIIEHMNEYDDLLFLENPPFELSDTQSSDLRALILDWMRKNMGEPEAFVIDHSACYHKEGHEI